MKRELEKDLIEIKAAIKSNKERDNTFTVSVLEAVYSRLTTAKNLLEYASEEIENFYGYETELVKNLRDFIK